MGENSFFLELVSSWEKSLAAALKPQNETLLFTEITKKSQGFLVIKKPVV